MLNNLSKRLINPRLFSTSTISRNVIQVYDSRLNHLKTQEEGMKVFDVEDPSNFNIVAKVNDMDVNHVKQIIDKSYNMFHSRKWKQINERNRHDMLMELFQLMKLNETKLAEIITLENGKTYKDAINEVRYAASFIEWFAEESLRIYGDIINSTIPNSKFFTIKEPVGVVGIITPWNFPLAMLTRKVGAAIAAGCTAVIKPASETPLTCLYFKQLMDQSGIPDDAVHVITTHNHTKEIGKLLCTSHKVDKISFTGSTQVGKILMADSASTVKKVSMELGGNAPFIVLDDADIDKAVESLIYSKFRNSGQTCVCPNRIFIHSKIYDEFIEKILIKIQQLKVGNGFKEVDIGPLISQKSIDKVENLLQDATNLGAKILYGGKRIDSEGYFFLPTLITDLNNNMKLSCEEVFGPVISCFKFDELEQVIKLANDTNYGLAAYAFTKDLKKAMQLSNNIQSGMLSINSGVVSSPLAPFGGVKQSGIGREGSKYGIHDYLNIKFVNLNY